MANTTDDDRIARERDFHNRRFVETGERRESSFYFAVQAAMTEYWRRVRIAATGMTVLEYGCSNGSNSIELAKSAKSVVGIDISDVAISNATAEARRCGVSNVSFSVENAENMNLPTASFDLVFGSGILHHLVIDRSLSEVRRILRDGGTAVFCEPLGHNVAINLYRRSTPASRTSDEHPLLKSDFKTIHHHFSRSDLAFFGLSTIGCIPFRGTRLGTAIRTVGERVDDVLLRLPGLKWQAWMVVMTLET